MGLCLDLSRLGRLPVAKLADLVGYPVGNCRSSETLPGPVHGRLFRPPRLPDLFSSGGVVGRFKQSFLSGFRKPGDSSAPDLPGRDLESRRILFRVSRCLPELEPGGALQAVSHYAPGAGLVRTKPAADRPVVLAPEPCLDRGRGFVSLPKASSLASRGHPLDDPGDLDTGAVLGLQADVDVRPFVDCLSFERDAKSVSADSHDLVAVDPKENFRLRGGENESTSSLSLLCSSGP